MKEWTQIRTSPGQRLRGRSGRTRHTLPIIFSQWSHLDSLPFSQQRCVTTHRVLLTREAHLSLAVQAMHWALEPVSPEAVIWSALMLMGFDKLVYMLRCVLSFTCY